jgi:WD40 repeat protein
MAAASKAATTNPILTPLMTLKGHGAWIGSISYFPDGQRMISGSVDKTARQWDLKEGKEIEEVRDVCEEDVWAHCRKRQIMSATDVAKTSRSVANPCEMFARFVVTVMSNDWSQFSCIRVSIYVGSCATRSVYNPRTCTLDIGIIYYKYNKYCPTSTPTTSCSPQ